MFLRNLKIEINETQPVDEILKELERLGYKPLNDKAIREWECRDCGTVHDRDVNSALNILALGHERLAGGIPLL